MLYSPGDSDSDRDSNTARAVGLKFWDQLIDCTLRTRISPDPPDRTGVL